METIELFFYAPSFGRLCFFPHWICFLRGNPFPSKLYSQVIAIQISSLLQLSIPTDLRPDPSTYSASTLSLVERRRRVLLPREIFSAAASIGGDSTFCDGSDDAFWHLHDFWRSRTTRTHSNTIQRGPQSFLVRFRRYTLLNLINGL